MISSAEPYVKIRSCYPPQQHRVVLTSNSEECFNEAMKVVRSNPSHLRSDKRVETHYIVNNEKKIVKLKVWIEFTSGTDIQQLVKSICDKLLSQGITCDVQTAVN
jgi:hypothetical protein